ncbi:PAS domain S-box protein [Methanobacterium sp.]|uniref:PAS domain S-box protein n=1 Tax=Methanobacterium sp. TaxID=2164 RepID=UPI002AB8C00D|nr:PAS domain S-box protein [Methanobacterium sp.]MDY9923001.1 PAS domain S-box protein [Methanobacterium sp.]
MNPEEGSKFTGDTNQTTQENPELIGLDAVINCSPLPQFVINRDHKVIYWNQALEEYSQINASDVLGTDKHWKAFYNSKRPCIVDLLVDEDIEGLSYWFSDNCKMSQLVEGAYEVEKFYPKRGLNGKYLHFTASSIKDHDGNVIGGLESFEDITQRKLAEKDLQESEHKFRSLVENLNVGVYRNSTDPDGYFIQVNPAFARMFGYDSTSEIMEIKVMDFYRDPQQRRLFLEDLKRDGSVTGRELHLKKKDNQPIWVSVSAQAHYDANGSINWADGIIEDITNRKLAEKTLLKSEKRYRSIVENINDGFCIHDFQGNITDCNENFALMLGSTTEGMIGTNLDEFSSTEMMFEKNNVMGELKNKGIVEFDADFKQKDGTICYYNIKSSIVSHEGNGRVHSFLRDVTKRREMEEILHQSENTAQKRLFEIEAIYNSAPIGLCVLDRKLRFVRINDRMAEINGFPSKYHIGKTIHEIVPDLAEQGEAAANEIFETKKKVISREFNGVTAAQPGVLRTWMEEWYPLKDSSHQIIGINVAALEITEIKKAEKSLKKSEEKLRLAIEGAGAGMWYWDLKNDMIEWTDEYKHIFGVNPDPDTSFNTILKIVHPDDREKVEQAIQRTLQYGEDFKVEMRIIWQDGTVHWAYSLGKLLYDLQGKPKEIIGIAINTTPSRIAEQELQETLKQLKRSNAELEQFAYVASHDLQEPLRMITSFLQLLQRRYDHQLDSDANEFIQFAVDGAARMQELVNDLLAYSRIERRTGKFEDVDTEDILKQITFDSRLLIEENNADISYDNLPVVHADYPQMVQVFQNLISNSIKYNNQESPIIHISAEKKDSDWVFKVEDNGIGIDPKHGERVFKIFQRLHGREEYGGTGIGLAIVKRIVERHGGMIWYDSQPGKGSKFYFNIPQGDMKL